MDKLVLIDGNSLINRAFYAVTPLSDKRGNPTNALYGFLNMLFKIIDEEKPKYILVAFDRKEPTFRHKMFDEYKGNRKPMPEDLRPQIPMLKELLTTMGIRIYDQAGVEADDIIGTFAKRYDGETVIFTGDKDSFQLVDKTTSVHFTKRGINDIDILDSKTFKEKTGIEPWQVVELKACMGDSSDNYPGIPGVGEKTALSMIQTYGTLDEVYNHLDDFKGKTLEKIVDGKDKAYLSRTLAKIKCDVDIPLEMEDLTFTFPFSQDAKKAFIELNFNNFVKRSELFDGTDNAEEITKPEKVLITELSTLEDILLKDILTIHLSKTTNIFDGSVEYECVERQSFFDEGLELSDIISTLKGYLENEDKTVICYSRKKLQAYVAEFGIDIKCKFEDVDILRYLVDFSGKEELLEDIIPVYNLYQELPAFSLYYLYNDFYKKLKEFNMESLYLDIEKPLSIVLTDMENTGFKIDIGALEEVGKKYRQEIEQLQGKINELAGESINPNSPKQLGILIFEKLALGKGKKTKTGSYSTSAEKLEELKDAHPIIALILRYREIQKLNSTYIEGLKPLINKKNNLVHTCFNQTLTQTGRLSSKEPNLQNIPVRDEEGRELRKLFISSSEDSILIDADYSQIELRLLAHFSECKELVDAYNEGRDIHTLTASQVFNVDINEVTPTMRRNAKTVNFGIIYGISEYGLASQLGIKPKEAKDYIDNYFARYPKVKDYMNGNVTFAKDNGYVQTLLGRRRYIPEIKSDNFNLRSFGERAAMNMPLQGTSADIIKIAMINVYNRLKRENMKSKLIMQVHDELIIDAPLGEVDKAKQILVEEMEGAVKLRVPLSVEANIGKSWYEAK